MHEAVKERLYGLFEAKGVSVEADETIEYENFCCLQIRYYPATKVTLHVGKFTDDLQEMLLIAHELGHILHYESLSPKDTQIAYSTIFASNNIGLDKISLEARKMMIFLEVKASEHALNLLRDMLDDEMIISAKNIYNKWIRGYYEKAKLIDMDDLYL